MNFERIAPTIDVDRMRQSRVVVIGGAYGLAKDLVRCGLGSVALIDFDYIDSSNPARQDLNTIDVGRAKIEATAAELRRIDPDVEIETYLADFCALPNEQVEELLGQADLVIDAADSFPVHARVNLLATQLGTPALWIGLYRAARAGEIVYWVPGVTPACYRCVCVDRYRAFHAGGTKIGSVGGTILDLHLVDAIAGQIAVGILTRGVENRMGCIIEALGDRNLLQIKIDPEFRLNDRDVFRERLGDDPANFSFTTIALPMAPEADCPDCRAARALQTEAIEAEEAPR